MGLVLCAALLCSFASAMAETELSASVGYDAALLSGRWIPLSVEITADENPVEGMLTANIGVSSGMIDQIRQPVSVPAGETRTYRMTVCPMVNQRVFEVRLSCGGDVLSATARSARAVPQDALVIGVLGKEAKPLADALRAFELRNVRGERETIEAIPLDAESFVRNTREMSAFDAMVVLDQAMRSLDDVGAGVLEDWQKAGGIFVHRNSADASMLTPELAARQVMSEIEAAQKAGQSVTRERNNYPYSIGLNAEMTADRPGSLFPAAALLTVYVLFAGVGVYLLMKRPDRSKMLWAVIPALSIAACGLMALLGMGLGVNQPMSSSVHLVCYDADGEAHVNEMAMLTYAGQARRVVSTQGNVPLERMEYGYFSEYTNMSGEMELRDVVTLGKQPSVELEGKADWLVRNLVIRSDAAPEGSVTAFAHMEGDGLHVEAKNNTDVTIENAVLLTDIGYALLGDLAPGAEKQTVLLRTDEASWDDQGNVIIRECQMLPFSEPIYAVVSAAVDPETALNPAWSRSSLPEEEQMRRQIMHNVLDLGASMAGQEHFHCMLIGETPQIACETLVIDGKPVTRRAQKSVLSCTAAFEPVSSSGYFYYPEGIFRPMGVSLGEDGVPVIGKVRDPGYVYEEDEVLLGFKLSGIEGIEEIRLYTADGANGRNKKQIIGTEAYDYAGGKWVRLREEGDIRIDAALARRVVSPSGELCLRFTGDRLAERGMRLPDIIVEGRLPEEKKGGEPA